MIGVLPYGVHFKPNEIFMHTMANNFDDVGILEVGAGTGYNLKKMHEFGKEFNVSSLANARGCDICYRSEYDCEFGEIFWQDATDSSFYHKGLQVLMCRPSHGGWTELLLEQFMCGECQCKRFIYVGLESNLNVDFTEDQLSKVSASFNGVGEANEIMLVWEF